jgi:hypothetical protein
MNCALLSKREEIARGIEILMTGPPVNEPPPVIEPMVAVVESSTLAVEPDRDIPLDQFLGRGTFMTKCTQICCGERWEARDRNAVRGSGSVEGGADGEES